MTTDEIRLLFAKYCNAKTLETQSNAMTIDAFAVAMVEALQSHSDSTEIICPKSDDEISDNEIINIANEVHISIGENTDLQDEFILIVRAVLESVSSKSGCDDKLVAEIKRLKDECQKAVDQDQMNTEIPMGSFNRLVGRLSAYEHLVQLIDRQKGG